MNQSQDGYTIFKSTGVTHQYPHVDLGKGQVTCIVLYKEVTYMTVLVDVKNDTVHVQGNIDELGELAMSQDSYLAMFRSDAKFFIDHQIANPTKYYEDLIKKLPDEDLGNR